MLRCVLDDAPTPKTIYVLRHTRKNIGRELLIRDRADAVVAAVGASHDAAASRKLAPKWPAPLPASRRQALRCAALAPPAKPDHACVTWRVQQIHRFVEI